MKKMLLAVTVFFMAMTIGTAAMALDFTDHVKIAPNNKGDFLIYPVYAAADGGWETKIWVINTAPDRSVVAKIVFRSRLNTEELRDFLVYLSPTDVWNGVIRSDGNGGVEVYSTDDSAFNTSGAFASQANPLRIGLAEPSCDDDTNAIGYVEIFESAHSTPAGVGIPATGVAAVSLNTPPVPKAAIYEAYQNAGPADPDMVTDSINVLAGSMEMRNLTLNQNSAMRAVTFRDYDATLLGGTPLNPTNATTIGEIRANNSVGEVEAALSRDNIALPFSTANATIHFLTFPTKQTILGAVGTSTRCTTGRRTDSPFFGGPQSPTMCIQFLGTDYDLSENSTTSSVIFSPAAEPESLCAEVNFVTGFPYAEGWANYNFGYTTQFDTQADLVVGLDGDYTGAPVIGTVWNLSGDGLYLFENAYSDGLVRDITLGTAAAVDYYYYQYQDESNTGYLYDSDIAPDQSRTVADGNRPAN